MSRLPNVRPFHACRRDFRRFPVAAVQSSESLERRAMLAGNVLASLSGGLLRLTGDARSNSVEVLVDGATGDLEVRGLAGTTVNGATVFSAAAAAPESLRLSMGSGADSVRVAGVGGPAEFPGVALVDLGHGDDDFSMADAAFGRWVTVRGGRGDDAVRLNSLAVGRDLHVSGGFGNDVVSVVDSAVGRDVTLKGQHGVDEFGVAGTAVGDDLRVDGGSHADAAAVFDTAVADDLTFDGNSGNDVAAVVSTRVGDDLTLDGDRGADLLAVADTRVRDRTRLEGNTGNDVVVLAALSDADAAFEGGNHFGDDVRAQLGFGHDMALVCDQHTFRDKLIVDGDKGTDRLAVDEGQSVRRKYKVRQFETRGLPTDADIDRFAHVAGRAADVFEGDDTLGLSVEDLIALCGADPGGGETGDTATNDLSGIGMPLNPLGEDVRLMPGGSVTAAGFVSGDSDQADVIRVKVPDSSVGVDRLVYTVEATAGVPVTVTTRIGESEDGKDVFDVTTVSPGTPATIAIGPRFLDADCVDFQFTTMGGGAAADQTYSVTATLEPATADDEDTRDNDLSDVGNPQRLPGVLTAGQGVSYSGFVDAQTDVTDDIEQAIDSSLNGNLRYSFTNLSDAAIGFEPRAVAADGTDLELDAVFLGAGESRTFSTPISLTDDLKIALIAVVVEFSEGTVAGDQSYRVNVTVS